MLYILFVAIAVFYNLRKFRKDRDVFLSSLIEAKSVTHREMILSHHFYIFIFEGFLSLIVAHLISEGAMVIGILGLGIVYLTFFFVGLFFYQFFVRYVEKHTNLDLYSSFRAHLIKELRVNFGIIMMPILIYSLISSTFQDSVYEEWGKLWIVGLFFNIIFVSVLTIACSVIIMLRLVPNREIVEQEYLDLINKRLLQINQPNMRVRWIESDIKNAFVVGIKLLSLSNQTMFIGRSLRTTLTLEEFDAVVAHELAHVANRHIQKRVIDVLKNLIFVVFGIIFLMILMGGIFFLYWGEDIHLHSNFMGVVFAVSVPVWALFSYSILFDSIRSHEYEADAYAVMELGASLSGLKSALEKLATNDDVPDYIKSRLKPKAEKGLVSRFLGRYFSTHPEISDRISSVEYKIAGGLPFNYYVSAPKKIRMFLGQLLNLRVVVPVGLSFVACITWIGFQFKTGFESVAFIKKSTTNEIIQNEEIGRKINSHPFIVGESLMYFIVQKKDEDLINHFVQNGADKGKTLMYISSLRDYEMFEKYYSRFQSNLTDDEYFLLLIKVTGSNFTKAHRLLVNSARFETMDPSYKEDIARIFDQRRISGQRAPASNE